MREIKFRSKTIELSNWVYGFCAYNVFNHLVIQEVTVERSQTFVDTYLVDKETLGQFTGLKDKNGTDIYEGDIYHNGDPKITYTVIWRNSGFMGKQKSSSSFVGLDYWVDKTEIIGNIYNNNNNE